MESYTINRNAVWFNMMDPVITFTGRTNQLKKLHEILQHNTGNTVVSQAAFVTGLGGIGKSELARKYAIQHNRMYDDNLIWIESETHESLTESFQRLAEKLSIPYSDEKMAQTIEQIYMRFGDKKSLFIFDNADYFKIIEQFLPLSLPSRIQKPHILITSRNQDWELGDEGITEVINLTNFNFEEVVGFIKISLNIPMENILNEDEVKGLAELLDHFPLAFTQALAFIKVKNARAIRYGRGTFEIKDYMKVFQDESRKVELLEHRHENSRYTGTLLKTWNVTLKKIKAQNKYAIKIIELLAYLVPHSIDIKIIFPKLMLDDRKREDILDLLFRYSMINIENGTVRINKLVQEVIRLQLKEKAREEDILENAIQFIGFKFATYDNIQLLSIWNYACDYGKLIDKFMFKYNNYKTTLFSLIIESGNVNTVKKILNHFKNTSNKLLNEIINSFTPYYNTPLFIAIRQNNLEMVKLLKEFGAEDQIYFCVNAIFNGHVDIVNYLCPHNWEYLLNAKFYSAFKSGNIESLNNLLKQLTNKQIQNIMELKLENLDPNILIGSQFSHPLHTAVFDGNLDIVKLFINYNVDVNFGTLSKNPLHTAVERNHFEIFRILVENGANFNNAINLDGDSVIHMTFKYGRLEMVKYLINNNKCNVNINENKHGNSILHNVALEGHLNIVKFLLGNEITVKSNLNILNKYGQTPIFCAMLSNKCEIVEFLLKQDNINIKTIIIHEKYQKIKFTLFLLCVACDALKIVKILIEKKGKNLINEKIFIDRNLTAIHLAAFFNCTDVIKYFKEQLFIKFDDKFNNILDSSVNNYRQPFHSMYPDFIKYDLESLCKIVSQLY